MPNRIPNGVVDPKTRIVYHVDDNLIGCPMG